MAIASFLVLVEEGRLDKAAEELSGWPELELSQAGDESHLVVVAECASSDLGVLEERLLAVPGVLAASTAYLNVEDEAEAAGGA